MRPRRFQEGSLRLKPLRKKEKVWVAQWWEDGHHRTKILGSESELTEGQAKATLTKYLKPLNDGVWHAGPVHYSFSDFVEHVYLPWFRRFWKKSTAMSSCYLIRKHLLHAFGSAAIEGLEMEQLQNFLDEKALTLSFSQVTHLRWFLNAVFKLALAKKLVESNPATCLGVPRWCRQPEKKRPLTEDEVDLYLQVLGTREQLIARLAIFEGLRPGEILALRWNDLLPNESLRIDERIYRGVFDTPKNGKTRIVALSAASAQGLRELQSTAVDSSPEGLLFPSERLTTPISLDNLWRRYVKPALSAVRLEWADWRVLRRTNSNLMEDNGVSPKAGADQRGHGLGVSMEKYVSSSLERKRAAVETIESAVARKRQLRLTA